jgi:rod shape-determining protein MreC
VSLGTLDRTPPPFFKQGASALSRLVFFGALSLLLMAADTRFQMTGPLRAAGATLLAPVQRALLLPVDGLRALGEYAGGLGEAKAAEARARADLAQQASRAQRVEQLALENQQLRRLLGLKQDTAPQALAAQVLYDAPDPYSRKVVIDIGSLAGVTAGSPVVDDAGVLGQVTRAYPLMSEVSLVTDRDASIPVLNTRTGARSVAFGDAASAGNALELRYMAANADVKEGDLLATSGVDGVYPPGFAVAVVQKVERVANSSFARIVCVPKANVSAARHVLVLQLPPGPARPAPEGEPAPRKDHAKEAKK